MSAMLIGLLTRQLFIVRFSYVAVNKMRLLMFSLTLSHKIICFDCRIIRKFSKAKIKINNGINTSMSKTSVCGSYLCVNMYNSILLQ